MAFLLRILPSALREKKWLCETYGSEFCDSLNRWCTGIAECCPDELDKMALIPIEDILDTEHKPWSYVWNELKDRTIADRLKSLFVFLQSGKPPFELIAAKARFFAQGQYWVNVIAVVRIDRVTKQAVVTLLTWHGDGN